MPRTRGPQRVGVRTHWLEINRGVSIGNTDRIHRGVAIVNTDHISWLGDPREGRGLGGLNAVAIEQISFKFTAVCRLVIQFRNENNTALTERVRSHSPLKKAVHHVEECSRMAGKKVL